MESAQPGPWLIKVFQQIRSKKIYINLPMSILSKAHIAIVTIHSVSKETALVVHPELNIRRVSENWFVGTFSFYKSRSRIPKVTFTDENLRWLQWWWPSQQNKKFDLPDQPQSFISSLESQKDYHSPRERPMVGV